MMMELTVTDIFVSFVILNAGEKSPPHLSVSARTNQMVGRISRVVILSPRNLPQQLSRPEPQAFRYVNAADHHHKNSSSFNVSRRERMEVRGRDSARRLLLRAIQSDS
jgi:hypothetical protein